MALVVSRKENESIMIGDDIEVCVEAIDGGRVRLSIDAPKDVKVLRYELTQRPYEGQPVDPEVSNRLLATRRRALSTYVDAEGIERFGPTPRYS